MLIYKGYYNNLLNWYKCFTAIYEKNRRTNDFSLFSWDIAQNSNGHKSVNFYPILEIQNSTDPCVFVSEYVRYMCLACILWKLR